MSLPTLKNASRATIMDRQYKRRLQQYGVDRLRVPAEPAALRVEELVAQGWSLALINRASGARSASKLLHRAYPTVAIWIAQSVTDLATADLINAADPWDSIPSVGALRRYRALAAIGYSIEEIATAAGIPVHRIAQLGLSSRSMTRKETHDAVIVAYDRLWGVPGSSDEIRSRAARKGWHPPLAWDDDDIDDPDGKPSNGPNRRDYHEERVAEVWRLTRAGLYERVIAERLGISERSVTRIKARTREAAA